MPVNVSPEQEIEPKSDKATPITRACERVGVSVLSSKIKPKATKRHPLRACMSVLLCLVLVVTRHSATLLLSRNDSKRCAAN